MAKICISEVNKSGDVKKLLASIDVLELDSNPIKIIYSKSNLVWNVSYLKDLLIEIICVNTILKCWPTLSFCGLLTTTGAVRGVCLGQLMVFLCHRFPLIRKSCAARLYESLMVCNHLVDENCHEDVSNILIETDWLLFIHSFLYVFLLLLSCLKC